MNNSTNSAGSLHPDQPDDQGEHPEVTTQCCRAVCWCHDGRWSMPWPEYVAMRFHQAYEELAPLHGYETRRASAVPWVDVPEQNRDLMVDVVRRLLAEGVIRG